MKKFLSIMLSILMVVTMLPMAVLPVFAAEDITVTIDTGESVTLTDSDGDGYYDIGTADELYAFSAAVNGGKATINGELTADITVNENVLTDAGKLNGDGSDFRVWSPIGNNDYRYFGTFDGGEHIVSGLYFNDSAVMNVGLFGFTGTGSKIMNVGVTESYICGKSNVGGVVGNNVAETVENCYNSGYVSAESYIGGVVGVNNNTTVKDCYNTGTVTGISYYVGGVIGLSNNGSTVTDCYNTGNVSGEHDIGGVIGFQREGTVENCYNTGKVTANGDDVGGIIGTNYFNYDKINSIVKNCYNTGTVISNSYYVGGVVGTNSGDVTDCCNTGTVTAKYMVGSVAGSSYNGTLTNCYYLNGCAKDGLGTIQFGCGSSEGSSVADVAGETTGKSTSSEICTAVGYHRGSEISNGFCNLCNYIPATLNADGYYEIGNAGQLFWFANYINTVDRTANAVLTADIDLEDRPWTPIGFTGENNNNFRGIFDGQNHTIEGLYVEGGRAGLGFFGEVRTGTVKNFTIYGEVVANTEVDYIGGVIGSVCGVNGDNDLARNGAIIQNITSYVNLTAKAHGIGKIGGFVGYANHQSLIENCSWYGTFDAGIYRVDSGAGGFIGKIQENTSEVTIRNCGAYGTIKTNYAGDYNNTATIYMGGFLSFTNTNAKTTLENCLFAGKFERGANLTDEAFLGAFGTVRSVNAIKNCYYLGDDGLGAVHSDSNLKPGSDNVEITKVTEEQLKSGEIAYKLGGVWGQKISTDSFPVLGGETVYYVNNCQGDFAGYFNTEGPIHEYGADGSCVNCGIDDPSITKYALTVSEDANGTVTAEKNSYPEGREVTLTIAPAEGYALESLTLDGTDVTAEVQNGTYTFNMPAKDVTVTAVFTQIINYDLWIAGERVTSKKQTISGGSGTAVYDPAANTLTLNQYTYTGGYHADYSYYTAAIYYSGSDTLKLVLNGENTVIRTDTVDEYNCGIYAGGNIEVLDGDTDGIGRLTVTAGVSDGDIPKSCGLYVGGALTVSSGTLTATGSDASYSNGVEAGSITIDGGSLTGIGNSCGVTTDSITIDSGSLTGIGDHDSKSSDGVFVSGDIKVNGGSLTGIGGEVSYSNGVYTGKTLTVNGGTLKATCGTAEKCLGVRIAYGLTLGSGISILTPVGGESAKYDYIYTIFDTEGNIATTVEIGTCTNHNFSDGKCACGYECSHENADNDEVCDICGKNADVVIDGVNYICKGDITNTGIIIHYDIIEDGCYKAGDGYVILKDMGTDPDSNEMILYNATIDVRGTENENALKISQEIVEVTFIGTNYLYSDGYSFYLPAGYNNYPTTFVGDDEAVLNLYGNVMADSMSVESGTVNIYGIGDEDNFVAVRLEDELVVREGAVVNIINGESGMGLNCSIAEDGITAEGTLNAIMLTGKETEEASLYEMISYGDAVLGADTFNPYNGSEEPFVVTFNIPEGTSVTVPEGITLNLDSFDGVTIDGELIVNGTLICTHTGGEANCAEKAVCEICKQSYGDIDADNHDIVIDEAVSPDCVNTGLTAGQHCSRCDAMTIIQETVPATNHKDTLVQVDAKAPTCTEAGYEAYEYCTACDYTTYKETPASHSIVTVEKKDATCTEAGHEAYEYCTACDYTTYKEIPASHSIVTVEKKDATCTEAGYEAYEYCTACDYTTYKEIPVAGHTEETVKGYAATCTKAGLTDGVKCSVCDAVITAQQTIDQLAHKDEDGDFLCDYGCGHEYEKPAEPDTPDTPDEPTDEACDHLCHKDGILGFLWKIICFFYRLFNIQQYCDCGVIHYDAPIFG